MLKWIWLAAGILLTASELALPGMVVIFLGISALLVAGVVWSGLIDSAAWSVVCWMGLSILLVLALRKAVMKWLPPEERHDDSDEELDAYGQTALVIEECHEEDTQGRIRFRGTTWPASTTAGTIAAGQTARLLYRDDLAWIVEPLQELDPTDPDRSRPGLDLDEAPVHRLDGRREPR
ncbi:MAG: NfeD family protein [Bradymonadales bacterium]|nr:NfeD family protein [Bradymonadales bacterium]